MNTSQPEGFTLRPATTDDVPAIYSLLQSHERALYGYSDKILAFMQTTYASPMLDLAKDTCLAFNQTGRLVGSMLLDHGNTTSFEVSVCVFPPEPDSHLSDYLLSLAENRARVLMLQAQPNIEVTLDS